MKKLLLILMLFPFIGMSQLTDDLKTSKLKPHQLKKMAEHAEIIGDHYSAIDYYEKYMEKRPDDARMGYHLATTHRLARDYEAAKKWYKFVYDTDPKGFPLALFYEAQMVKMGEGDYDGAYDMFKRFKKEHKAEAKEVRRLLKAEMKGCETGKTLSAAPPALKFERLDSNINKAHIEMSPLALDDETMIFSALRENEIKYYEDVLHMPKRKFYKAKLENKKWVFKGEFTESINGTQSNSGNGCLSLDGSRFYFTRCNPDGKGKMTCAIYVSEKNDGGGWQVPHKLPSEINHPSFTTTQPSVGTDPKTGAEVLYFISDRTKTKGGMDLWYSIFNLKKSKWGKAKNAGRKINTDADEMTPYYDQESNTMYISSAGRPGLGGLDVYKHDGFLNKWTPGVNLGNQVNSRADDLYYTLMPSKDRGFVVSNREGGAVLKSKTCCDDIYEWFDPKYVKLTVSGIVEEVVDTGIVFHADAHKGENSMNAMVNGSGQVVSRKPAVGAEAQIYLIDPDSEDRIYITSRKTDESGQIVFNLQRDHDYLIIATQPGFFNNYTTVSTMGQDKSLALDIGNLELFKVPEKPVVVDDMNFPYNKYHLTLDVKNIIDKTVFEVLVSNPTFVVEIGAHTDDKGSNAYNKNLSEKRAKSVVKYLTEKGISKDRISYSGHGEEDPIAPNTNPDGSDNEEGRAKNRRIDIKVLEEKKTGSVAIFNSEFDEGEDEDEDDFE